ncbi:Putative integrase/recombinase [Streptomyces murinus]
MTVRAAADVFLDSLGNPNTLRNYGIGVGKTAERLGESRPLAMVADDEIGEVLELLWGTAAVNTWNARRAAVLSWLDWCRERGHDAPAAPHGPSGWRYRIPRRLPAHAWPSSQRRPDQGPPSWPGPRGLRMGNGLLGRRHSPTSAPSPQGPYAPAGVRHSPAAWPRQGRQSPGCVPGHRPRPSLTRAGSCPAGRAHHRTQARHRVGPARIPSLRPDAPRRGGGEFPDADGQVDA